MWANSYVCRSYKGKTGGVGLFRPPPSPFPPILNRAKMLVALSPIFVADTKITFAHNFVAPLKWRNYNWVFKEITKSFTFKYLQMTEVYLEPIQTSKIELFVKTVNSLMPLTILTNCSILDAWLGSKIATKSFNKCFCEFNIFILSSHLVKYFFPTKQWCLTISKESFIILKWMFQYI